MVYRKDIDGLRALAVVPVILYHGGFTWFSGGFVGVDIFFIISGYLITSIILKEKEANRFTIANFYERRARRILPALFFVMIASLPAAWLWLLPHELVAFGKSILSVNLFSSNFLFWSESGYFAEDAEMLPFLHTWSLAVEEQFYVFFPLLIILLWKWKKPWMITFFSIIGIASFVLTQLGWQNFPEANFYLIPTRAWELIIGALVTFYLFYNEKPSGLVCHPISLAGLGLILYGIVFLDKSIPYPSFYTMIPALGTALIILFTTPETVVYKLLSTKGMVAIGLVSYSAYLWHWPLFVFTKFYTEDDLSLSLAGLLSIAALLLAYFSWRFVERPFRDKQKYTQKQIFIGSLLGSLFFIAISLFFIFSDGIPSRFS